MPWCSVTRGLQRLPPTPPRCLAPGQGPISRFDQFNEVPSLREVCPQVARFGHQPVRGAISRVDEAFAGFYRRTTEGQTPGYPRFKSGRRFRTVMYDEPVNWALKGIGITHSTGRTQPTLYLQGVGEIALSNKAVRQLRRLIDRGGEARTLSITKTASGAWRATVAFRGVKARRLARNDQVGGSTEASGSPPPCPTGPCSRVLRFCARPAERSPPGAENASGTPRTLPDGHGPTKPWPRPIGRPIIVPRTGLVTALSRSSPATA